jgi:hypothetical protein
MKFIQYFPYFWIVLRPIIMDFKEIEKKIRLLPDSLILILNAPTEYLALMSKLQVETESEQSKIGKYDFVQIFGTERSALEQMVKKYYESGKYDCLFWICYPKGGGKIKSDINRKVVWEIADSVGMNCVTSIAIDETWSALRCRPKEKVGKPLAIGL